MVSGSGGRHTGNRHHHSQQTVHLIQEPRESGVLLMKGFQNYQPPTTDDLAKLKENLGMTGNELAALAGVADGRQWRKYTGGAAPREMSAPMLFLMAARLELSDAELDRVLAKMRDIGGRFDFEESQQL